MQHLSLHSMKLSHGKELKGATAIIDEDKIYLFVTCTEYMLLNQFEQSIGSGSLVYGLPQSY